MSRIAQMYGATEDEVREAEYHAALAPLVPLREELRGMLPTLLGPEEIEL